MEGAHRRPHEDAGALRLALEEFYAEYLGCLNEERFEEWPEFFVENCLYKIVPRENFERGLPLATWLCESKGYLKDRVVAIRKTAVYAPRYIRRIVSGIRILRQEGDEIEVRADYAAFETLLDDLTRVFNVGVYHDLIVREEGSLKFRQKVCVFDSMLVPNSLIYPL
jgi:3-phenylpropionate/cinnamic acid dioxygenase small subunit